MPIELRIKGAEELLSFASLVLGSFPNYEIVGGTPVVQDEQVSIALQPKTGFGAVFEKLQHEHKFGLTRKRIV